MSTKDSTEKGRGSECPFCGLSGGFHDTTKTSPHLHLRPVLEPHVGRAIPEKLCNCGQFLSSIGAPTCRNPNHERSPSSRLGAGSADDLELKLLAAMAETPVIGNCRGCGWPVHFPHVKAWDGEQWWHSDCWPPGKRPLDPPPRVADAERGESR